MIWDLGASEVQGFRVVKGFRGIWEPKRGLGLRQWRGLGGFKF